MADALEIVDQKVDSTLGAQADDDKRAEVRQYVEHCYHAHRAHLESGRVRKVVVGDTPSHEGAGNPVRGA